MDIATGTVVQGPGMPQRRGPSVRWAWTHDQDPVLFDFESGNVIHWPWWTDAAKGALERFEEG